MIIPRSNMSLLAKKTDNGMALVITLAFIVILTVLVIAFFSSIMLEQVSSTTYPAQTYRQLLVDAAIAHSTALLAGNIPPPNYNEIEPSQNQTSTNWWVNPGRLSIQEGSSPPRHVNLYSTPVTGQSAGDVDLNALTSTWDGGEYHPVEPSGAPLEVAWVEVLRDPQLPRQSNRASGNYNPVVGRYAFWIDSDTNRINFQTSLGVDRHVNPLEEGNYDPSAGNFLPKGLFDGASSFWWASGPMALGSPPTVGYDGLVDPQRLDFTKLYWNNIHDRTSSPAAGNTPNYVPWLTKESIKAFVDPAEGEAFWEDNRFLLTNQSDVARVQRVRKTATGDLMVPTQTRRAAFDSILSTPILRENVKPHCNP